MKKIVLLAFVLMFFLTAVVVDLARPVEVIGTIYIRADGSIDPPTANITTVDNVTYTLTGNIITDGGIVVQRDNIVVDGASHNLKGPGVIAYSNSRGINLTDRSNVTIKNMEIEAFYYGVWLKNSSNIKILGLQIIFTTIYTNGGIGISLRESSNNTMSENNITNSDWNIQLVGSSNNIISGNTMTDSAVCIDLLDSSNNNVISGNTMTANMGEGIYLVRSSNNSIYENTITYCGSGGLGGWRGYGIELSDSSNNNEIYENVLANNGHGIYLYRVSNNSVYRNNITANHDVGIGFGYSDYNSVYGNDIRNNERGINIFESPSNKIYGNSIMNNTVGIAVWYSSTNSIYHNDFVHNTHQVESQNSTNVWDDGYPSGGNYWSNFKNRHPDVGDDYQGPNQDQPGSDGIWDQPYIICENNQDNYPLVPEFPPMLIMPLFMIATLLTAILLERRKHFRR